ncbi:MAG: hypothetical protein K6T81_07200 [Alicyclobacillus macrosporangiidus]|uniref:hypothetical protein n=1 Tax=Alicyclobacillus macrosporangiidus TaxID=392015 RepID=UPI0026F2215D|nr:hypothetical protein [Alicyclobacillus macrosporangiidus]MCL6598515.1 hypothetical protein [Alicyclobacillus macrosporangiidus]
MKAMTLHDVVTRLSKDLWGFSPTRDIKPVHLANGLFRHICGNKKTANPSLLHAVAAGYISGKGEATEKLNELRGRIVSRSRWQGGIPDERINELRYALDLVLNQDRALYANSKFYTMTLTNYLRLSKNCPDGQFFYSIYSIYI